MTMFWRERLRDLWGRDRMRPARSFIVAPGEAMPLVGDVLVLGPWTGRLAGTGIDILADPLALRVEGTQDRTVFYIPLPPMDIPENPEPWLIDRQRGAVRV